MARRRKDKRDKHRITRRDGRRVLRWNWRHSALEEAMAEADLGREWLESALDEMIADLSAAEPIARLRILAGADCRMGQEQLSAKLRTPRDRLRVIEEWMLRRLSAKARAAGKAKKREGRT